MTIPVSILGLGLMGRPMARTLIGAGWPVRGWNRSVLTPALTAGIPVYQELGETTGSEIFLLMLADSAAVAAVLEQLEERLRPGQLILDMGSSDPAQSRRHAKRLARRGIGWVDAPVSGGPEGAANGTLAIMAGGNEVDFQRVRPLLEVLGNNVVHVGGPGMGHTVKIINQVIVGLVIEAVAEALTLAEKSGLDPRLVQQALQGGFADSKILQIHGRRMIERNYAPGGKVKTQLRDLKLAQALADEAGLKLPHLENTITLYEQLMARDEADLDHSALHKLLWADQV